MNALGRIIGTAGADLIAKLTMLMMGQGVSRRDLNCWETRYDTSYPCVSSEKLA